MAGKLRLDGNCKPSDPRCSSSATCKKMKKTIPVCMSKVVKTSDT